MARSMSVKAASGTAVPAAPGGLGDRFLAKLRPLWSRPPPHRPIPEPRRVPKEPQSSSFGPFPDWSSLYSGARHTTISGSLKHTRGIPGWTGNPGEGRGTEEPAQEQWGGGWPGRGYAVGPGLEVSRVPPPSAGGRP